MNFETKLIKGQFIKRYKRFFAEVKLANNEIVIAHVPNTGSMKGLTQTGTDCYVSYINNPNRKLKYTLQQIKTETSWVGVNTHLPNKIVYEAWEKKLIPHWTDYSYAQPEFKISKETRLDLLLSATPPKKKKYVTEDIDAQQFLFVEIKNVTLANEMTQTAQFPDATTTRGQKHICELTDLMEKGHLCELFFLVQRTDCTTFEPAKDIDPLYADLLKKAHKKGLRISAFSCSLSENQISLNPEKPLKIKL